MKKLTFTNEDIAAFCSEMNYLLHAGVGNADALQMIADDESRPAYAEVYARMARNIEEGSSLPQAVQAEGSFPAYIGEMLSVGERTGRIEEALSAITADCESRAATDRQLKSALMYPAMLLLIMLAVIAVLIIYVLPIFNRVYSQLGSGLTGIAGGLMTFGAVLSKISPLLIVLFIAVVLFLAAFSALPTFRSSVLGFWRKKRGDKGLAGKISSAHFAQALSLCMSSGLQAEDAVESAAKLLSDSPASVEKSKKCVDLLFDGTQLSKALKESGLLPASHCTLLEAGVRGGSGDIAMAQIAKRMSEDSNNAVEDAVSRVEPAIVIVSSVLVGVILLAVMLPLVNIMSVLG